jgi:hypothetical protein
MREGYADVDVFFILSGFVLTCAYVVVQNIRLAWDAGL